MSGKEYDPAMHVVQFDSSLMQASVELFIRAFSKPPRNDIFESEEEVTGFFHAFLAWPNFRGFHLLSDEGQVSGLSVGFIKPWLKEGRLRYEYFIDQFYIGPRSHRQGLGTSFLRHIEDNLREDNIHDVIPNTGLSSPACRLYKKRGLPTGLILFF